VSSQILKQDKLVFWSFSLFWAMEERFLGRHATEGYTIFKVKILYLSEEVGARIGYIVMRDWISK